MFATSLLIISIVGVIVGTVMIISGYIGKRVGDHPHCQKCGFDLFGQPEPLNRCPECGKFVWQSRGGVTFNEKSGDHPICRACGFDLRAVRRPFRRCPECGERLQRILDGIVIGEKVRHSSRIAIGSAILSLCAFVVIGTTSSTFRPATLSKIKPTWWLKLDAKSTRVAVASIATEQLYERACLKPEQTKDITDFLLDEVAIDLTTRPVVRHGDSWPILVNCKQPPIPLDGVIEAIECDGNALSITAGNNSLQLPLYVMNWNLNSRHLEQVLPGEHRIRFHIAYWLGGLNGQVRRTVIERTLKVVAPPDDSVELLTGPALHEKMRAAMGLGSAKAAEELEFVVMAGGAKLKWPLDTIELPVPFFANIIVIDDKNQERQFAQIGIRSGRRYFTFFVASFDHSWDGFNSDVVTVVFRPDASEASEARYDTSTLSIWGEDIVIPNVRVIWQAPKPTQTGIKLR